jgi:hypothetical protein
MVDEPFTGNDRPLAARSVALAVPYEFFASSRQVGPMSVGGSPAA